MSSRFRMCFHRITASHVNGTAHGSKATSELPKLQGKRKHQVPAAPVSSSLTYISSGSLPAHPVMLFPLQLKFCSHQWFLHSDFLHSYCFTLLGHLHTISMCSWKCLSLFWLSLWPRMLASI